MEQKSGDFNIYVMGVPKEKIEISSRKIFKEIVAEKFSILMKHMTSHIQKAQ